MFTKPGCLGTLKHQLHNDAISWIIAFGDFALPFPLAVKHEGTAEAGGGLAIACPKPPMTVSTFKSFLSNKFYQTSLEFRA